MIGSYGDTLLNWLNTYTFPTEAKFKDKSFADMTAKMFFRQILSQGTTTANVFATTFATSVDAFFEESERYNTRMISGKVLQDRNLPDSLKDESAEESILLSEQLLKNGTTAAVSSTLSFPASPPLPLPNSSSSPENSISATLTRACICTRISTRYRAKSTG